MSDIKTIMQTIEHAVNNLDNAALKKQGVIYKEVMAKLKKLETKGDKIANNITNLSLIN